MIAFLKGLQQAQVVSCLRAVVVVVLLLYVPSQQLWSLRDGQFT